MRIVRNHASAYCGKSPLLERLYEVRTSTGKIVVCGRHRKTARKAPR